jgi:predicted nucleic acid-binding protein
LTVRIHVETGILIDYIAQGDHAVFRATARRGREPSQLYRDAKDILQHIADAGDGSVSALTFYEVEEALYSLIDPKYKGEANARALKLAACRPVLAQALTAARLFNLKILELREDAVQEVARSAMLLNKAIRAADALHITTAARHDVELILSADRDILKLDGQYCNAGGVAMRCLDSDAGLAYLRSRPSAP